MSFLDIAKSRYTTKKYDPEGSIDVAAVQELQEVLRLCPSSINSQPWLFTFIADQALKEELAEVSFHNKEKIKNASHVVVFASIDSVDKFEKDNLVLLPEGARGYYARMIKPKGDVYIKDWMARQVYLSLGYFLSACAVMGIDSTPMEGVDPEAYDRILRSEGYKTLFAVAIGRRDKEDVNQPVFTPKFRFPKEKVIREL